MEKRARGSAKKDICYEGMKKITGIFAGPGKDPARREKTFRKGWQSLRMESRTKGKVLRVNHHR